MNFASSNMTTAQRDILGLPVCDLGWAAAFALAEEVVGTSVGQSVIAFLDTRNANLMMRDPDYRAVLRRQIVLPEGHGLDLACRMLHGRRFSDDMTATAFVPALLTYLSRPLRIALIGGAETTLLQTTENLRRHTPWHDFLPIADGSFDRTDSDMIMKRVHQADVDILLVAMGSPAQEKWIDRHVGPGHARLVLSVGSLFDVAAAGVLQLPASAEKHRRTRIRHIVRELANPLFVYNVLRYKFSRLSVLRQHPTQMAKAGSL